MDGIWMRMLSGLGAIAFAGLMTWAMFGRTAALVFVALSLTGLILYNAWQLVRLFRWLHQPGTELPVASGVWDDLYALLYRLSRQQGRRREELVSALDRFRQAAEALPDGVVILDEDDCIVWFNPASSSHFGLDQSQDLGQQIGYLVRHPDFIAYLRKGVPHSPLRIRMLREQPLTLSIQIIPYGGNQKLLLSRDITRFEQVETVRRDFVANVSHELRTPLTVVAGFLETLTDARDPDPKMVHRSLELMSQQTRRMQRLVEDLLTLAQLENARRPERVAPVNVPELVRQVHAEAASLSAGRHSVLVRVSNDTWLEGSAEELRSAFGNLASNAVRYTPDGGRIEIAWEADGNDAVFSVSDSGIGIDMYHLPRLTERFYRVDRSRSRETGGTGLGLAIVKHVLSRHDAILEIESKVGHGSRFAARFPAERRFAPPEAATDTTEKTQAGVDSAA